MERTTIFLVRHGKPEYQYREGKRLIYGPEALLSNEGKKQAFEISERLPRLDNIYSSTFSRALSTAEIIAKKYHTSIINTPELVDIVSPSAVGLPLDDVLQNKIIPQTNSLDETIDQLELRTITIFKKILEAEKDKTVCIVGHGHGIRLIAFRFFENNQDTLPPISDLEKYNYLNPCEAWKAVWNNENQLITSEIIARPETKIIGKRYS